MESGRGVLVNKGQVSIREKEEREVGTRELASGRSSICNRPVMQRGEEEGGTRASNVKEQNESEQYCSREIVSARHHH